MISRELRRIVSFGLVGGVVFLVYLGVMSATISWLGASQVVGAFTGFIVGTFASYFGNAYFSFGVRPTAAHSLRFWIVTLVGLGCNLGIAFVFERLGMSYVVTAVVIFATVPVVNYLGHRLWTFRADLQSQAQR